ncbi:hypothetical protein [Kaarinaea lacus]
MKVVYEFVVADRADSQLLAQSQVDQLSLPYFRCFGLDPANLAALYFLINDKPYCDTYLQQFSVLHHNDKTCDSLVEMPRSLCDSLASLPSQQLPRVLNNWQEKEGFSLGHWHEEFKRNVLLNLVQLSKECQDRQQSLILKVRVAQHDMASQYTLH